MEPVSIRAVSTLLDPRFKVVAFGCSESAAKAVNALRSECCAVIRTASQAQASSCVPSTSTTTVPQASELNKESRWVVFWQQGRCYCWCYCWGSALSHSPVSTQRRRPSRLLDPTNHYIPLSDPAGQDISPHSSHKAGILSMRRNRLSPITVKQIVFLNKIFKRTEALPNNTD